MWQGIGLVLSCILVLSSCRTAEDSTKIIRKLTQEAVEAFNDQDAESLSSIWEEDATYLDLSNGSPLKGRAAIEQALSALFQEHEGMHLDLQITSITLPTDTTALESGVFTLISSEKTVSKNYRASFEKKEGRWLLTEISEAPSLSTHYENLKGLEWLVGDFVDTDENSETKTKGLWDKHKNFITQHFTITTLDHEEFEGEQIIGFDTAKQTIRSWTFDTDGGIAQSTWKQEGEEWKADTSFTLADGKIGTATHVFSKITPDSYTWQAINRQIDGQLLPDIEPVLVQRVQP
jgi:uncharacterized protein (TIGR02246 family)